MDCKQLCAYIRVEGRWTVIGYYGTKCKKLSYDDYEAEKRSRELQKRLYEIMHTPKVHKYPNTGINKETKIFTQ
ncbi:hypothetical protein [Nitrosopumilus sp.]|uniref:hypothetical protein n=1 Tax=Nitrosopumilus sp. TaxID=2024843 RepID=UPI003D10499D